MGLVDGDIMIKCVECHREAEYVMGGASCCKLHFDLAVQDVERDNVI